ncbi:hypothetical protein GCM10022214_01640 [Actinomadura miaoliensis]|uniref:Uncharacterized protein n=1 Tax=Actinomadura miaoliensis TaxID=430685 RepID=A0ABP7UWN6_9ACTN
MNQTLKDIGSILWVLLLLSVPATVIFFVWLGMSRIEGFPSTAITVTNDSSSPVRVVYYDADEGFRPLYTEHLEIPSGGSRPVGGGDDCERPHRIPRSGDFLLAQTPDGRTARLGPPQPCGGAKWRITDESLRKGVKPTPSPPLWSPTPARSEKSSHTRPG